MKIRYLTLLTTLVFLGLCVSAPAFAGKVKNCDPDEGDVHPSCDDVSSDGDVYTAELLSGAFKFSDQLKIVIPGNRELDLTGVEDAVMERPGDTDLQETWDDLFSTGCPELIMGGTGKVLSFVSSAPNWTWEKPGWRRLVLRNIHLMDAENDEWEIRVQLIGKEDDPNVPEFLPTTGYIDTTLIRGRVNGRALSGGSGGRKSCQNLSGTKDTSCQPGNDKMEGFCLKNGKWSKMRIEIIP